MQTSTRYQGQIHAVEYAGDAAYPYDIKHWGVRLWLVMDIYGATHLIGAKNMNDAYEIYIDSLPEIPQEEVKYAYGFDSQEDYDYAIQNSQVNDNWDDINLVEGYDYCSQATTTGIVSVSEYIQFIDVTPKFKK